jgi:hypothetical protein
MGLTAQKYTFRRHPQLSANQIADYLGASPTRRKSIIRAARFPKLSVVAQYGKAREGLVNFLGDGTRSKRHLADARDYLAKRYSKAGASDWLKRDSRQSGEAVDAFDRAYNKLGLRAYDCRPVPGRLPRLDEWGTTRISVDLDLTIHVPTDGGGRDRIGGIILLFSRGASSGSARIEQSRIIASLILQFCNRFMIERGDPDKAFCLAIDVFEGRAHRPHGIRKMDYVRDACEEIATRWLSMTPPDDYDGSDPS